MVRAIYPPPIWGHSRQLDDQHRNTNMNDKDHPVGQLTSTLSETKKKAKNYWIGGILIGCFLWIFPGINHNVDELLVGILTQLRLKRQKAAQQRTTTNKVAIYFFSQINGKPTGDGFSGEVRQSGAWEVVQQPQHLVNMDTLENLSECLLNVDPLDYYVKKDRPEH